MQVIGHGDNKKENHQGAAHGDYFPSANRGPPQRCAIVRQCDDLRENSDDCHTDPDEIERQLHNL